MSKHITIDAGTCNTTVYSQDNEILFCAPSLVAINTETGRVVASGNDAFEILGRTPAQICVISPIKNGEIADFEACCAMLKVFLGDLFPKSLLRPKAILTLPPLSNDMQKRAIQECAERSGVKIAKTIPSPLFKAQAMGIDTNLPKGTLILDIGAGVVSATVISFGGIVTCASSHHAGCEMDEKIKEYIKKNYSILVGTKTAEQIKFDAGIAHSSCPVKSTTFLGRDLSGLPKDATISSDEIKEAISDTLSGICRTVSEALQNTPAELSCDILKEGIILCGGGARLCGLSQFLQENAGVFVRGEKV